MKLNDNFIEVVIQCHNFRTSSPYTIVSNVIAPTMN